MRSRARLRRLARLSQAIFALALFHQASGAGEPAPGAPKPMSQALEAAAAALGRGEVETAQRGFGNVVADTQAPAFVRGLARLGLAETSLARGDTNAAIGAWRETAADASLHSWHRSLAQRRAQEAERTLKGLPARDPATYRTALPDLPAPGRTFHVSAKGDDSGDGSEARPFATLSRARNAVRELRAGNGGAPPAGGVRVSIDGGTFAAKETLALTELDSGTPEGPVVYSARAGTRPTFDGGARLRGWKPVSDEAIRAKLSPDARRAVLEADLAANGITDYGDATGLKRRPELFVDGVPQTLARWPNEGFIKTGEVLGQDTFKLWGSIAGCRDGKFRFVEDRPKAWVDEPDVRLYGYWFWDWYEEYQTVSAIDAQERTFTLAKPYSSYGYRKDQRYFAVNVLRELDQPGEWYLDRRSGRAYWFPPPGTQADKADIVLSQFAGPFLSLKQTTNVFLMGLAFEHARGDGILLEGGSGCLVAGCELRRLGGDAVVVKGGVGHGIFGCSMRTLGCGGMRVDGGDRQLLKPGGHYVENCTVSDIARIKRTYAPAVHLDGCGNRVAHNLFERIPSSAMRIEGNDHLIELNVVRHVVQESDDQGGIDMFGNPLYRGVVIRWNRWTDIVGGTECGAAGIRLDDMISGIVVYGNLFERCGAFLFGGVQVHGGKENVIDGNAFIDCHAGVSFSAWDEGRWLKSVEPFLKQAGQEPYAGRYPDLGRLKAEPNANYISRNLLFGCRNVYLRNGGANRSALVLAHRDGLPAESLGERGSGSPLLRAGLFEILPLSEMGPYPHAWRAAQ